MVFTQRFFSDIRIHRKPYTLVQRAITHTAATLSSICLIKNLPSPTFAHTSVYSVRRCSNRQERATRSFSHAVTAANSFSHQYT